MAKLFNPYSRHLYVRIWLAVVGGVIVLTLAAGWLLRVAVENERERVSQIPRVVTVTDDQDRVIGGGSAMRVPGAKIVFDVSLDAKDDRYKEIPRYKDIPHVGEPPL